MSIHAIIPASGSGVRFSGKTPKQFIKSGGKEIIAYTLNTFNRIREIDSITIATRKEYFDRLIKIVFENRFDKVLKIVEGGTHRMDSVYNALMNISCAKNDFIIIHDAVRPFVSPDLIRRLIKEARRQKVVIPGLLISDTVKKTDNKAIVKETVERENLYRVQTPQVFRFDVLVKSFEKAYEDNFTGTDEASITEYAGYKTKIINGETSNIKITVKEDLKSNFKR
ncbi:MAG: 2-C-methyl-D-erythritol 4-phosphate cytidylyltransferase [Ignavibacteriae bacterium]|nr:2-C-methyl-D-erythritol 4-phosphate cytidylyltransferase [Ignavibacteriota bacterium]